MGLKNKNTDDINIPRTATWSERTMAELARRQVLATEALIDEQRQTNRLLSDVMDVLRYGEAPRPEQSHYPAGQTVSEFLDPNRR